jgi:predicted ATPase/DNA-binding XRE family transcriptional regulator
VPSLFSFKVRERSHQARCVLQSSLGTRAGPSDEPVSYPVKWPGRAYRASEAVGVNARSTVPAEFGALLRRLRSAAELSQEELAERARMSVDAIGQLERGRRRAPQRETVDLLLIALRPNDEDRAALLAAAARARVRTAQSPFGAEAASRHNLPAQLTDLIGREGVVAEIHALLADARLVTLVGAGGIGKTRAALEVAAQEVDHWPDGVWFVELAPVGDAALVAGTIALALGAVQQLNETAMETLLRHVKQKQMLLLVDNCEHLIDEVAQIAERLLRERPHVKLLATSRELLRVAGERVYPMPSLDDSSAALLFEKRARAADPAFALANRDATIIVDICRRLDGMPLAIELAAARVRTLALPQLARKLDERFAVLRGGNRTALPRQQTMQALIDWSYDLLAPQEQRFFRRFAVFAGGCSLDAAAAVCSDPGDDAFDLLASLVDKSLVVAHNGADEQRYALLESMRAYAMHKLDTSGERDAISRRHVEYIACLVDVLRPHTRTSAREALSLEIENVRAALSWCANSGDALDLGARILAHTSVLYTQRLYGEYVERSQYFLEHADGIDPALLAGIWLGIARRAIGVPALDAAERAIALLEKAEDRSVTVVRAHLKRAKALAEQCRISEALEANMRVMQLRDELCPQDAGTLASIHHQRGYMLGQMHDDAAARREYETAAAIYDSIGDRNGAAYMRCNIGDCYYREGDAQTAIRLTRENLSVFRELRNWDGEAFLLCNLAEFDIVSGDLIAAAQDIAAAVDAAQRLESGTWLAATAFAAAGLAAHAGDLRAAARLLGYVRSWKTERAYYEAGDLRLQTAIEELLETGLDHDERELLESEGANLPETAVVDVILNVAMSS